MPVLKRATLFTFFLINSYCGATVGFASFFAVDAFFADLYYLSIALSLRTLASCSFSYVAYNIIQQVKLKNSFIFSQCCGLISLAVLSIGFKYANYLLTVLGIMIAGIPITFVTILMNVTLKSYANSDTDYRRASGVREILLGTGVLMAALTTPLILTWHSTCTILLVGILLYLVNIVILFYMDLPENTASTNVSIKYFIQKRMHINVLNCYATWQFIARTSSGLLLASFVPLVAASTKIHLTIQIPSVFRQTLWAVEPFTILLAGALYVYFQKLRQKTWFHLLLCLNAPLLFFAVIPGGYASLLITVLIVSLVVYLSFQQFRDDYILAAGNNFERLSAFSSFSMLQRNFVYFISPFLLASLLGNLSYLFSVLTLIIIQLLLYFFLWLIAHKKKENYAKLSNKV